MLTTRLIAGLTALPIVLTAVYLGGLWFLLGTLIVAWIIGWEFWQMARAGGYHPTLFFVLTLITLLIIDSYRWPNSHLPAIISLTLLVELVWQLYDKHRGCPTSDWAMTLGGGLYIGLGLAHLVALRQMPDGMAWVYAVLFANWGADTWAYFIGKPLGRTKLWPRHSPAKTVEGLLGGIAGSIGTAMGVGLVFPEALSLWHMLILGLIVPIVGLFGDLCESMIKRDMGVKDSSNLFPGHGGFLDRADSVLFVTVVVYYYVVWLGG